jgi:hypothetical protein
MILNQKPKVENFNRFFNLRLCRASHPLLWGQDRSVPEYPVGLQSEPLGTLQLEEIHHITHKGNNAERAFFKIFKAALVELRRIKVDFLLLAIVFTVAF